MRQLAASAEHGGDFVPGRCGTAFAFRARGTARGYVRLAARVPAACGASWRRLPPAWSGCGTHLSEILAVPAPVMQTLAAPERAPGRKRAACPLRWSPRCRAT